jgi:hypothetical protein
LARARRGASTARRRGQRRQRYVARQAARRCGRTTCAARRACGRARRAAQRPRRRMRQTPAPYLEARVHVLAGPRPESDASRPRRGTLLWPVRNSPPPSPGAAQGLAHAHGSSAGRVAVRGGRAGLLTPTHLDRRPPAAPRRLARLRHVRRGEAWRKRRLWRGRGRQPLTPQSLAPPHCRTPSPPHCRTPSPPSRRAILTAARRRRH